MVRGDEEEFQTILSRERKKNLNIFYRVYSQDFDEPAVQKVLHQAGAFYNDSIFGVNLLHVATALKKIGFVILLIEAGCDINTRNLFGQSSLHVATSPHRFSNSDDEIHKTELLVRYLFEHGAKANSVDEMNRSPIFNAVKFDSPTIARALIANGGLIDKLDCMGLTPLHMASCYGGTAVVEFLLDNDAEICRTDLNGDTPFTRATYRNDDNSHDILKLLLEKKGKCDKIKLLASEALTFALSNCDLRSVKLLTDYGAHLIQDIPHLNVGEHFGENFSELHYAAKSFDLDVIKYVLDKSIDVNIRSKTNLTPLHVAADYGRSEACKLLLSKGANINFTNNRGHSPLYLAVTSNKFSAKKFYKSGYEINPNITNNKHVINILIAHLDKLLLSNIWVNQKDFEIIGKNLEMQSFHKSCLNELENMKLRKVYEDVSLFDILMKKDMTSRYAKNEKVIEALDSAENDLKHEFAIYYSSLKEDFDQKVQKQRSIKEAAIFLNQFVNFADPLHAVPI